MLSTNFIRFSTGVQITEVVFFRQSVKELMERNLWEEERFWQGIIFFEIKFSVCRTKLKQGETREQWFFGGSSPFSSGSHNKTLLLAEPIMAVLHAVNYHLHVLFFNYFLSNLTRRIVSSMTEWVHASFPLCRSMNS